MNLKNEKGINLIALTVTIIVLLIIAGIVVKTGLEGINSIDDTRQAGIGMEKKSIVEAIQGEIENLRTRKLIAGENIDEEDIELIIQNFVSQHEEELSYSNKKIKSVKGFEITVDEVK